MNLFKFGLLSLVLVGILLAPVASFKATAQGNTNALTPIPTITGLEDFKTKVDRVLNLVFTILLIASVVVMIYAGYSYVTSGGKDEQVKAATQMIVYAAVGLIVALLSKALQAIIPQLF